MIKIFLDTEFTGLHQKTTLISIALVAETGEEFYAEFTDYDTSQIIPWLEGNVLNKLNKKLPKVLGIDLTQTKIHLKGNRAEIKETLNKWFTRFEFVEIWSDVLAYDWVLFCELFGGALAIPQNIFYIPFDLSTLFRIKGMIEPSSKYAKDISRFDYTGTDKSKQHHALEDARVQLLCYDKMMKI